MPSCLMATKLCQSWLVWNHVYCVYIINSPCIIPGGWRCSRVWTWIICTITSRSTINETISLNAIWLMRVYAQRYRAIALVAVSLWFVWQVRILSIDYHRLVATLYRFSWRCRNFALEETALVGIVDSVQKLSSSFECQVPRLLGVLNWEVQDGLLKLGVLVHLVTCYFGARLTSTEKD